MDTTNEVNENTTSAGTSFWSWQKFGAAHVFIIIAIVIGLRIRGVGVADPVGGFYLTQPTIWYIAVAVVWCIVLATFTLAQLRRASFAKRFHSWFLVSTVWLISAGLAWALFLITTHLYIMKYVSDGALTI